MDDEISVLRTVRFTGRVVNILRAIGDCSHEEHIIGLDWDVKIQEIGRSRALSAQAIGEIEYNSWFESKESKR